MKEHFDFRTTFIMLPQVTFTCKQKIRFIFHLLYCINAWYTWRTLLQPRRKMPCKSFELLIFIWLLIQLPIKDIWPPGIVQSRARGCSLKRHGKKVRLCRWFSVFLWGEWEGVTRALGPWCLLMSRARSDPPVGQENPLWVRENLIV